MEHIIQKIKDAVHSINTGDSHPVLITPSDLIILPKIVHNKLKDFNGDVYDLVEKIGMDVFHSCGGDKFYTASIIVYLFRYSEMNINQPFVLMTRF